MENKANQRKKSPHTITNVNVSRRVKSVHYMGMMRKGIENARETSGVFFVQILARIADVVVLGSPA